MCYVHRALAAGHIHNTKQTGHVDIYTFVFVSVCVRDKETERDRQTVRIIKVTMDFSERGNEIVGREDKEGMII